MEPTEQRRPLFTELSLGDTVQVYRPKAMGRIGTIVGFDKDKILVRIKGVGTVSVEPQKALLVKKADPNEVRWIRRRT